MDRRAASINVFRFCHVLNIEIEYGTVGKGYEGKGIKSDELDLNQGKYKVKEYHKKKGRHKPVRYGYGFLGGN